MNIVLDTGPLGRIIHPRANPEISRWFGELLSSEHIIIIPEIADYELRRNLILEGFEQSIQRLDQLEANLFYLPIETSVVRKAAQLWAEARKLGKPTADPKELDGDVLLAAQTLSVDGVIATENVGHLSMFVSAKHWRDIPAK